MEHVAQVEVVKATASSMYGSGASNGVIHMRTAWPGDEPETFVSAFNGVYSDPIPRAGDGGTTAIRRCPTA